MLKKYSFLFLLFFVILSLTSCLKDDGNSSDDEYDDSWSHTTVENNVIKDALNTGKIFILGVKELKKIPEGGYEEEAKQYQCRFTSGTSDPAYLEVRDIDGSSESEKIIFINFSSATTDYIYIDISEGNTTSFTPPAKGDWDIKFSQTELYVDVMGSWPGVFTVSLNITAGVEAALVKTDAIGNIITVPDNAEFSGDLLKIGNLTYYRLGKWYGQGDAWYQIVGTAMPPNYGRLTNRTWIIRKPTGSSTYEYSKFSIPETGLSAGWIPDICYTTSIDGTLTSIENMEIYDKTKGYDVNNIVFLNLWKSTDSTTSISRYLWDIAVRVSSSGNGQRVILNSGDYGKGAKVHITKDTEFSDLTDYVNSMQ